jgi:hypothetical protein
MRSGDDKSLYVFAFGYPLPAYACHRFYWDVTLGEARVACSREILSLVIDAHGVGISGLRTDRQGSNPRKPSSACGLGCPAARAAARSESAGSRATSALLIDSQTPGIVNLSNATPEVQQ